MHVLVMLGTARTERRSAAVYEAVLAAFESTAVSVTATDVREILSTPQTRRTSDEPDTSSRLHQWQRAIAAADKVVMVVPEYNHSFPGEWKLALDALEAEIVAGTSVYLVTVSAGGFGGVRVAEQVQPVLHTLGLVLQRTKLHVSHVAATYPAGAAVAAEATKRLQAFVATVVGDETN